MPTPAKGKGAKKLREFAAAFDRLAESMTTARSESGVIREDYQSVVYLGIDPGAEGAVGFLRAVKTVVVDSVVLDIPTFQETRSGSTKKKRKTKTSFDLVRILEVFDLLSGIPPSRVHVTLEQPPPSMGPGRKYAEILLNKAYALWPLFLASRGYQVLEVAPSVWKKDMGVDLADKSVSLARARLLFGQEDLVRLSDHNRAEALLLAEYGRKRSSDK